MAGAVKDILKSDEWQKAVDYEITDHDIDRQRLLLGFDQAARTREYIQTATEDNIRNFAHGCGDDLIFAFFHRQGRPQLLWLRQ